MDVISAYRDVGTYRGAAAICGTTHKTVRRIIEAHENAAEPVVAKPVRARNYDAVADLVAGRVKATSGKITAKRLLPEAVAAGYGGSARNFRRLVADAKQAWRSDNPRGRRPGVWTPGENLIIDWGELKIDGVLLHVFCAVMAWSRFRFVRFAAAENAVTTMSMLAECFEELGGVPKVVLTDRMGCLKGAVVANITVPTPDYVRFATHYRFRPDFCEAADPQSKGMVENLVGYAKSDLMVPLIGSTVTVVADEQMLRVIEPVTGEIHAEHQLVAPGETSIVDDHYGGPRPDKPRRAARPRTQTEKDFLALGPVAEAFLTGAAAAGVTKLGTEIGEVLDLGAAHGHDALLVALERAVEFSRWRAGDIRSILATNGQAPNPRPAGDALAAAVVLTPADGSDPVAGCLQARRARRG